MLTIVSGHQARADSMITSVASPGSFRGSPARTEADERAAAELVLAARDDRGHLDELLAES